MYYLMLFYTFVAASLSYSETSYKIDLFISEQALKNQEQVSGTADINWQADGNASCFYLAFNDRNYFWDPSQDVSRKLNQNNEFRPTRGGLEINQSSSEYIVLSPHLIQVPSSINAIHFNFTFSLPQWTSMEKYQYLFHGFYPQRLSRCPTKDENSFQFQPDLGVFQSQIHHPKEWLLSTPAFQDGGLLSQKGRFLSFNLSLNYKFERVFLDKVPVTLVYNSPSFTRFKPYLLRFLVQMEALLGPYPFERLVILETEELERPAIPGIITINRPKQIGMDDFQGSYLNWTLWQLAYFTAQQWIGASSWSRNFDNNWFFRGFAEFIASLILSGDPELNNIIASDGDAPWFEFSYRQSADLVASVLNILNPNSQLVDEEMLTFQPFAEQSNFGYIRHYLLLRFLHWYIGDDFLIQIKRFYQEFRNRSMDHFDFLHYMIKAYPNQKEEIISFIQKWWSQSSWPDFKLADLDIKKMGDKSFQVVAYVDQPEDFTLPYDLVFSNQEQTVSLRASRNDKSIQTILPFYPEHIEINPNREIYDSNRFNNSTKPPEVVFFPGNANTIRDDAYTVIWFPFAAKLPGEGTSLLLGTQIFKYVNSGLSLMVAHVPSEKRTGFNAIYLTKLDPIPGMLSLSLAQNFGPGLIDQRVADLNISRPMSWFKSPKMDLGFRLRHRTILRTDNSHESAAIFSNIESESGLGCGYRLYGIHEKSLVSKEFSFNRTFGILSGQCKIAASQILLRSFWGGVEEDGDTPDLVRFSPQTIEEAKIRIDTPLLSTVQRLWSTSFELEFPSYLPFSSSFFLMPKKSTWRLFYDIGQSHGPDYLYSASGLGFRIPLGGDVVGKRSLAIANFTVLAVFNKKFEGQSSDKPGILIDFMGKL